MRRFILMLLLPLFVACTPTTEKPACGPGALAEIEASYVAEMRWACDGVTFKECLKSPDGKRIEERYDTLRKEWVECR